MSGLSIQKKTGAQLKKEENQKAIEIAEKEKEDFFGSSEQAELRLAGVMRKAWERNRRARISIDERLLFCLRSRKGEYSRAELTAIVGHGGVDPVFIKLTGTKCRAASSWIRDIILPAGERPWSIVPTSMPELPPNMVAAVQAEGLKEARQLVQAGIIQNNKDDVIDFVGKVHDRVQQAINMQAKASAVRMMERISEEMDEGDWDDALEGFIDDFVTYPTAFFKGPYFKKSDKLSWGENFEPVITSETRLHWKRISPFDFYPAPQARTLQEGDVIERLRLTRGQLYNFIGMDGYKEEAIREVLKNHDTGKLKEWIWQDFERNRLEMDTYYYTSEPDTIDALHYWGPVQGDELIEWGMNPEGIDPEKSYEVDAILIGKQVIRAVRNEDPLHLRPYHWACWDAVPGSIWGISLPEQMEDHQKIINACGRSLCSNMALAAGPQVVVMVDQVPQGEDITTIFPFKIWQAKSNPAGGAGKPVDFFQPSMNTTELMNVMSAFEAKADDVTNVPRYSYGNTGGTGGAGNTASGLSMLMNAAAKGIRRAIAHIDANVIRPSVHQAFIYMMIMEEDVTIKGDCDVVPRGATALLIKDQSQVRVQAFLQQTANPIDMQIIGNKGRAALLRANLKLLDLPVEDIVPSDDDIALAAIQAQAAAQQQQMQQLQMEQQGSQPTPEQAPPPGLSGQQPLPGQGTGTPGQPSPQASLPGNQSQIQQNQIQGKAKYA